MQNWRVLKVEMKLGRVHREIQKFLGQNSSAEPPAAQGRGTAATACTRGATQKSGERAWKEQEQKDKTATGREAVK